MKESERTAPGMGSDDWWLGVMHIAVTDFVAEGASPVWLYRSAITEEFALPLQNPERRWGITPQQHSASDLLFGGSLFTLRTEPGGTSWEIACTF